MSILSKQRPGIAAVLAPVIIGLLGLLGTAAVTKIDQDAIHHRDILRLQQIHELQIGLQEYKTKFGKYPTQKDERHDGWNELHKVLVEDTKILTTVPRDPLNEDRWSYRYWSDGKTYSLRWQQESGNNRQEQIVYGQ